MDLSSILQSLQESIGSTLPKLLGALAILLIGYIIARLLRTGIRKGLALLKLDERIASSTDSSLSVEKGASAAVFYLVMAFVLLAFFNALELQSVSSSLQMLLDQVMAFLPKAIAAGALALVAWVVAVVVRVVVVKAISATSLDQKVPAEEGTPAISNRLGAAAFGLTLLFFLPGVLGALGMNGLLAPVQGMVDQILATLPKILAAAAIGLVGWFLARIVREVVTSLLAATNVDALSAKAGMKDTKISGLVGLVVYVLILVPAIVASLNALEIDAISAPATEMLTAVMTAIPNVFAAAMILGITWFVGSLVSGFVASILQAAGLDRVPAAIGLGDVFAGETTLSRFCGKAILFFAMLFAATEAASRLGFGNVAGFVTTMTAFGGQVLLGVAIIGVGLWLSNLARTALEGSASAGAASAVRFAILGIVFAMGLRAMGLADEIVNLTFGLTLGAIAVAAALAFGIGGREAAGRQLERWLDATGSGGAAKGKKSAKRTQTPRKPGKPSPLT